MPVRLALFLAALAAVASGCGGTAPAYSSAPATPETTVDGSAADWPAALRPVPGEPGLGIGLRNTDDALYLVLVASDERQARRIALGGLRLWLDPAGGTDPALGVRFPASATPAAAEGRRERAGRASGVDGDDLRRRFRAATERLQITRADQVLVQDARRGRVDGLATEGAWGRDALVVEARLPLVATPGLLASDAGETVGVGVELLDLTRGAPPDPRGRGRMGPDGDRAAEPPTPRTITRWLQVGLD